MSRGFNFFLGAYGGMLVAAVYALCQGRYDMPSAFVGCTIGAALWAFVLQRLKWKERGEP